ncbi:sensor domain-containing diguanylate cyclase [Aestuariirhabdus sp. Z084]|uniref:sensor domain-containing diguanylate cyclase n=1 Tax=Aestuariirhabdus haliotis TaxID=2918751 RepID=UPI00201B3ABE|nr:sensor domain-containing diguanylate cyclase [Aestuariirhabdus haliotis]MCL6416014.1 sensor domain-containing diguanylate cyclase [Aestuariirhabdus haliotis]MCL6419953.1 sensor domain-containing diguanylate cyclase [Aestuariirhabdus haliotis]
MLFELLLVIGGFVAGILTMLLISKRFPHCELSTTHQPLAKEASEELERNRLANSFARIGTWDWHIKSNRLQWSDEVFSMFGYDASTTTPTYELFLNAVHPDDVAKVKEQERICMEGNSPHEIEYRIVCPDGTVKWLFESGDVLCNEAAEPERFTGIVRDITASKERQERIRELAHYDALTGLPNRELFRIRMHEAMQRAEHNEHRVALVFMDLNNFKPINDQNGHIVGDKVLHAVGQRLKHSIRSMDTIARVGGDEFVAVLEEIKTEQDVVTIVEHLRDVFLQPITIDQQPYDLGVSIGIALSPDHSSDIDELIHIADMAMYRAKQSGTNSYSIGQARQPQPA